MLGVGDLDWALAERPDAMAGVDEVHWERLALARQDAAHAADFASVVGQRLCLPTGDRRAAGPSADAGRVEGSRQAPGGRRRARRPAHRPRVPGQLQVPVENPAQLVAGDASSTAASASGRPTRWPTGTRSPRPASTRILAGRTRGPADEDLPDMPGSLAPVGAQGPRLLLAREAQPAAWTRRTDASRTRSPIARQRAGPPRYPTSRPASGCSGGCCASPARRTSCSARRAGDVAAPPHRHAVGLAAALQAQGVRGVGRASRPTDRALAGRRHRPRERRRPHGRGHVEVRWSHGRFRGAPEAKVYLDTQPTDVPGFWPLT